MRYKTLFCLELLIAVSSIAMGQVPQKPVNVPSPTAFAFQQYGNLNTSHYTGALQLNIPLYELSYKDLRMPVVLNYNSTGLRVDQVPGWVGANFSMNIGGTVTRQIKGLPDEFDFFLTSECQTPNFSSIQYNNGYLVNTSAATFTPPNYVEAENDFAPFYNGNSRVPHSPLPFKPYNVAACAYTPQGQNTSWPGDRTSFPGSTNVWDVSGKKDLYPDEFTFSSFDLQGTFRLEKSSQGSTIVITANRPVKVTMFTDRLKVPFAPLPQVAQGYDPQISYANWSPWTKMGTYPKTISGFQIIDDRGIKYYFGKNTEMLDDPAIVDPSNNYFNGVAIEYSIGSSRFGYCPPDATDSKHLDYWKADAWHLVRVLMPDGRKVDLNYERGDEITTFQRGLFKMVNPTQNFNSAKSESFEHKSPVYLSAVVSDLVNIQLFRSNTPFTNVNYNTNNGYTEMNRYVKLDSMTIKDHAGPLRCFGFGYQYDPANRWFLKEVREKSANAADLPLVYQLEYDNINVLPPFYSGKTDHWGYFNNNNSDLVTADNLFAAKETDPLYVKAGALTKITYPTGGSSTFEYEPNTVGRIVKNKSYAGTDAVPNYTVGGLRIKRIYNNDGITGPNLYKQFYYTNGYAPGLTDAQLDAAPSSGILAYKPAYTWTTTVGDVRMVTAPGGYTSMNNLTNYPVKFLANQPLHALLEENPVGYSTVVEKNLAGGYVVHQFTDHISNPNLAPINEYNNFAEAPYAKASSKAFERGLPSAVSIYNDAGQLVSKELTSYAPNYLNADGSLPGFTETAAQALEVSDNLATIQFITGTTIKRFNYQPIERQKENMLYDGSSALTTKVQKFYDNPLHKQLTRVVTYASNGDILRKYMKYPQDYNTGNYLVQRMVANGYNSYLVETISTVQKNGTSTELVTDASLNEYNLAPANTNDVLVHRVYNLAVGQPIAYSDMVPTVIANNIDWNNGVWAKDGRYKLQMVAESYTGNKTIASYTDKSGTYIGILYDKDNLKQAALIQSVNGPLATDGIARFAVANFETGLPNEGKWEYLSWPFDNAQAHTGQYSFKGDLLLKAANTTSLGYYDVWIDVWAKSGGNQPIVERRAALNTGSMMPVTPTIVTSENGWTLYRYANTGVTPCHELYIRANGNSIDDIKVYPTNGNAIPGEAYRFTTFAYNSSGQLSFSTDPNNRRIHYAYDRTGRLATVTDQDGNIVKKYCYRINGQPEDCGLYYNVRIAQTFARNNCAVGTTGETVQFVAPAAMFSSAISQADADAQALAYLNANGQAYANANGNCTANNVCANCMGIYKKCIDGKCELGIQVTTNCYYNTATGQYEHTYHYEFSDGSWSTDVTDYSSSPICFTM